MNIVLVASAITGSKTATVLTALQKELQIQAPAAKVTLLDLRQLQLVFSDGRDFREYEGDTRYVAETIMQADALVFGSPVYQAGISGALKNVLDLLPARALADKVATAVITAGSPRHFLVADYQLKPILNFMKAVLLPSTLYVEEKDLAGDQIVTDEITSRIKRLAQDLLLTTKTYQAQLAELEADLF